MNAIDLSTPEAQERVASDARRRPAGRRGVGRLQGVALRQAIVRLRDAGKRQAEVVKELGCSRTYVSRFWTATPDVVNAPDKPMGRPAFGGRSDIPPDVLARMCAKLQAGSQFERPPGQRGAPPGVDLLDVPGVAECFPVPDADTLAPEVVQNRQRLRIRQMIHQGRTAPEGSAARALYEARQAGLLRRDVAA